MDMGKERRGGARLNQEKPPKRQAHQNTVQRPDGKTEVSGKVKLSRGARIAIIVVAALAAILLILAVVYKSWAKLPDLPILPQESQTPDPVTGIIPPGKADPDRKDGFYTFLVVGRDTGGGGNTDTIMLAAYDVPNQKLSVMSIPRDTMVNARHPGKNKKINGVWNLGLYYAEKGNEKKGVDYLKEAVGDMTGVTPDFYVIVNWEAFGRLVDAIGGVDFEVPFEMKYKDPTQDLVIDQAAGLRHLTGEDAMEVVRWRHNNTYSSQYRDGDLGRIRTQQALMKEIVKKCLKIENVANINKFAEIFTEEVETDLTLGNLVAFAERAILGGLNMDNVTFATMPVTGVYVGKASYVQAQPEELLGIINEHFNPYREPLEMEELEVLQYNSSRGYYIYSGTGTGKAPTHTSQPQSSTVTTTTQKPTPTAAAVSSPEPSVEPSGDEPVDTLISATPDPEEGPGGIGENTAQPSQEVPEQPEPTLELPIEPEPEPVPTAAPTAVPPDGPPDLGIPMN